VSNTRFNIQYPDPDDCTLKFANEKKQHPVSFFLIADFESFLTPTDNDDDEQDTRHTKIISEHNVSGFCCHRVTQLDQYRTPPTLYSGEDVMSKFHEHVTNDSKEIGKIMASNLSMEPLTPQQQSQYTNATVCGNCKQPFTHRNWKVRHHDHLTGKFLFPCCNDCNLQLKSTRTHRGSDQFFLPVIFHNLKNYDSHFIMKNFEKYVEKQSKDGKIKYDDIKVIPLNSEKFITFQIGNLRFLDSYQFLSTSLEDLVSLLLKSGKQKFVETIKYLGDHDLVFAKGVYPYAYMTDRSKFDETRLPPIDCFYNDLKDEPLTQQDYDRAQQIWTHFDIQNLRQFHDHYLVSDVLLLSDVFQHFDIRLLTHTDWTVSFSHFHLSHGTQPSNIPQPK